MLIFDFEVYKHDWMLVWLDCNTHKYHSIVNNKEQLEKFYYYYRDEVMVGYNSRNYDVWIMKAILCDFNPYLMSDWLINKERKGHEFSPLLNQFPILNYDCSVGFRSLKELEAFMGDDIRETSVPFDIDRKLTDQEIHDTLKYCKHDVQETLKVFVETSQEYNSHVGLIREFGLPVDCINKTKAQISAMILGAYQVKRNDEFDITLPDTLCLDKYANIAKRYLDWAKYDRNYENMSFEVEIAGVPHVVSIGGLHGAIPKYYGTGLYIMADVGSYYPAIMIEYNFLSRNVSNKSKFKKIRDDRIIMKAQKDPRQQPRKIVLNSTFGASKDKYNRLFDPLMANNICIAGQLLLIDLIEKLEDHCQLIQSNTDGILIKLYREEDRQKIMEIFKEWMARTRMDMEFDDYTTIIQRDVNNYIMVDSHGHIKRKGAVVKKLSTLDNDLPIVNKAVVDWFVNKIPPEETVMASNSLIDFQKITKVGGKYEYGFKEDLRYGTKRVYKVPRTVTVTRNKKKYKEIKWEDREYVGYEVHEKVHRVFASLDYRDGALYKKSKTKQGIDKTPSTPDHCRIVNSDINGLTVPEWLDVSWYISLAKKRIKEFI